MLLIPDFSLSLKMNPCNEWGQCVLLSTSEYDFCFIMERKCMSSLRHFFPLWIYNSISFKRPPYPFILIFINSAFYTFDVQFLISLIFLLCRSGLEQQNIERGKKCGEHCTKSRKKKRKKNVSRVFLLVESLPHYGCFVSMRKKKIKIS